MKILCSTVDLPTFTFKSTILDSVSCIAHVVNMTRVLYTQCTVTVDEDTNSMLICNVKIT